MHTDIQRMHMAFTPFIFFTGILLCADVTYTSTYKVPFLALNV